jgi:hypothetical protein
MDLGDTQEHFEKTFKFLAKNITRAKLSCLREGLPHQFWEPDLLQGERKAKKTVEIEGFLFYEDQILPSKDDVKTLSGICANPGSYKRFSGEKRCGGFHPDWCIDFEEGKNMYHVLICFGCSEARIIGPKSDLHCDLDAGVKKSLSKMLISYDKNRPKKKKKTQQDL